MHRPGSFSASASRTPHHTPLLCLLVTRSQLHLRTSPTSGMGLVLGGRARVVLTGHADASWVDDLATQRSTQGYTFSLGSGSVSWRSTRSSSVLSSSCETEIYAGAMAAQELRWLTYLLTDLGEAPRSPPVLYVDNKAMLALCQEHRLEHRTKHIALRYFLARELQQRGQLRLAYVASEANTADVFTKALQPCDHQQGRPIQFDAWLDDLQLYLMSSSRDGVSLFDLTSGASLAPLDTADSATRSQWLTRDAAARLAIRNHLPLAERAHFGRHKTARALYDAVVARYSSPATDALGRLILAYLFPALSSFATVADLVTHLRTSDTRYRATLPAESLAKNPPPMYITLYFILTCLPNSLSAVKDLLALDPTDLTVDLLKKHLLAAETSIVAVGASCGTTRTPFFEGCFPSPLVPSIACATAVDFLRAEEVEAASAPTGRNRSGRGKEGQGGGGGCGGGGGGSGGGSGGIGGSRGGGGGGGSGSGSGSNGGGRGGAVKRGGSGGGQRRQQQCRSETSLPQQLCEWFSRRGASGGSGSFLYVIRTGNRAGQTCRRPHTQHRCFFCLDDAWRAEFGDEAERPRWAELLRSGVAMFDLDYNPILTAMYPLSISAEGDCYLCVPPDTGIEAAALGASEFALPGTTPAEALHTFTLDSSASRCFFRDSTTLTPLPAHVPVRKSDPSRGPVLARSSTVLLCPAVLSGSLSGLHLPSFSTNLVSIAALQDAMVTTTTPGGQRVSICTCTRTGHQLATFTRRPRSSLYTLSTEPPQVVASAQVSAPGPVAPPYSCRHLSHQTLLWHHRLGHPSLPRLRGMHSRLLVSGLPRSLPPLPPSPAPPCLPCIEGRQRAAPHSSSFPPMTAPLQTFHMDVGGEFSSDLLRDFCRGEGILQLFTLPASPQQNGIAECRIGLVMEVARTSMIHAAAPYFLWPFVVWYAAHQLNLWPRVSLPETSPTLRWSGKVGDASVFRVWVSRAFVHDTSADKLSAHAIPCIFLGFPTDAPSWQFYHPTLRRVFPSQDVTFDKSVPFYHLFPYRSAPPPPPLLFLAPSPPLVDPLPPQGPAPSGVSQVDPLLGNVPVEVTGDSGATPGAASGGAASGEPGGAEPAGVELGGAEPEGVERGGAKSEGVESGGAQPRGTASCGGLVGASPRLSPWPEPLSLQQLREWFAQRSRPRSGAAGGGDSAAGGAGVTARAGGTGGAAAAGPGGAWTRGIGAAGIGGVGEAGAGDPTEPGAAGARGARAGGTGAELEELELLTLELEVLELGVLCLVVLVLEALGDRDRTSFLCFSRFLVFPSFTDLTPPLLCPPPDQSQPPLEPTSPLPAPSPYTEQTGSLTERREPASRPTSPVRTGRRVPHSRPPPIPGTHAMALRPSSVPLRVPLLPPPESSIPAIPNPDAFKRYKLLKIAMGEEKMPGEGDARDRWIEKSAVLYDLILQSVNNDMFQHIKDLVELDDSGPKAWKLLRDVIQPNTLPMVIVLEKELAALSMKPGDGVKPVLDKIKDIYARMAAAGSEVSQMQQCTKIISVLDNSWDNLIPTLNVQQDKWTPEWLRQQILQEDFRRRHTGGGAANKTAEGYGAAGGSRGRGGGRGRGRGRGFGRGRGRGDYNEGHVSSGGRGSTRMEGACWYCKKAGHPWFKCFSRHEGWAPPGMKPPSGERARGDAVQGSGAQGDGAQGKADPGMFLMVEDVQGSGGDVGSVGKVVMHPLTHWVIDSGCTSHMTPRADLLDEVKPPRKIKFVVAASGDLLPVIGVGNAKVMGANGELVGLGNVLLVEGLSANLLSVRRLQKSKAEVTFGPTSCRAKLGKLLLWNLEEKSSCIKDLWQLPIIPWKGKPPATAKAAAAAKATAGGEEIAPTAGALDAVKKVQQPQQPYGELLAGVDATGAWAKASSGNGEADWETWHERLCHVNIPMLQKLVKDGCLKGLEVKGGATEIGSCPTCLETKFTKFPFSSSTGPAKAPLALVHMDVVGPTRALSLSGSRYFLTIVDDHTRAVWVYPLKTKGEVAAAVLKEWMPRAQRESGHKVKVIRTDNGGEFIGADFEKVLKRKGIQHQLTVPYNPQQNGVAERFNRTLQEGARTLLGRAGLPDPFWVTALRQVSTC
ncbi:unnamed protein product [Closterium sp. NIES-53]